MKKILMNSRQIQSNHIIHKTSYYGKNHVIIVSFIHLLNTYIKSFVIVWEPLARALNSTPIKFTDAGYFHSTSFPNKQQ